MSLPELLLGVEEVSFALKNAGISFSQDELDEVAQTYAVLRDGLEQAAAKFNLKEAEPDYIRDAVPA